jgi:nucleotide-binding universal stress UspA family protein
MIEIRDILYPTDFSDASRHALEHTVTIARWYDARITALHVSQNPLAAPLPFAAAAVAEAFPPVPSAHEREAGLRAWLEPAIAAGLKTELALAEGNPVRAILDQASSTHASLIVMGTHGWNGFEHFMLGSVTEKVLRKAPCPVLTVPPAMATAGRVPYTQLLCAVDFSDSSLTALRLAASLAQEANAKLTILHVFDSSGDENRLAERVDAAEFRRAAEAQAREQLDALVTDDMRTWCAPATRVSYGKPYREILNVAAQDAMDLIVLGVHGRNPLNLALFGSTTSQVVRHATCPVLTLRS